MPDDLLELIAPGGCDEANHGVERYRVDNNGRIWASREAADYFIRFAGFRPVPPPPDPPPSAADLTRSAPANAGVSASRSRRT